MKLSKQDQALLTKYRALPKPEKERVLEEAQELLVTSMQKFVEAAANVQGFSAETKKAVVESVYGPLNQTEEEALRDDSRFSRSFDVGLIVSIIEIMKSNGNTKTEEKET